MSPLLATGGLMLLIGFGLLWVALGRHGALNKQRTFEVLFGPHSPYQRPENRGDRLMLRFGGACWILGAILCLSAVGQMDQKRLHACRTECQQQGYAAVRLGPMEGRQGSVCWCVGGDKADLALSADW